MRIFEFTVAQPSILSRKDIYTNPSEQYETSPKGEGIAEPGLIHEFSV